MHGSYVMRAEMQSTEGNRMADNNVPKATAGQRSRKERLATLRTHASHIAGQGINAFGVVNDLMLAQAKEEVRRKNGEVLPPGAQRLLAQQQGQQVERHVMFRARYDKGVTLPATPEQLREDVEGRHKNYQHSRTLDRNMKRAGNVRPVDAHSHHIVAHRDYRAHDSQNLLFSWAIALNDTDNGVYLPAYKASVIPEFPYATKHAVVHTRIYHIAVFDRLNTVSAGLSSARAGREALRGIKNDLLKGAFPYLPDGAP